MVPRALTKLRTRPPRWAREIVFPSMTKSVRLLHETATPGQSVIRHPRSLTPSERPCSPWERTAMAVFMVASY